MGKIYRTRRRQLLEVLHLGKEGNLPQRGETRKNCQAGPSSLTEFRSGRDYDTEADWVEVGRDASPQKQNRAAAETVREPQCEPVEQNLEICPDDKGPESGEPHWNSIQQDPSNLRSEPLAGQENASSLEDDVKSHGWRTLDICLILERIRIRYGISKIALGELLQVFGVCIHEPRNINDPWKKPFPTSKEQLETILKPVCQNFQGETMYICMKPCDISNQNDTGKCFGAMEPFQDPQNRDLQGKYPQMKCKKCSALSAKNALYRNGSYWVRRPLRDIVTDAATVYGKRFFEDAPVPSGGLTEITDITNAQRMLSMELRKDDIKILLYADGAAFSNSSGYSGYLVYVEIINFTPRLRRSMLYLYALFVKKGAKSISQDRAFIFDEFVSELQLLTFSTDPAFKPIIWMDSNNCERRSGVVLVGVKGDTPEIRSLGGFVGHTKGRCIVCHQDAGERVTGDRKAHFKRTFGPIRTRRPCEIRRAYYCLRNVVTLTDYKNSEKLLGAVKRKSAFIDAPNFHMIRSWIHDEMHTVYERTVKTLAQYTLDPGGKMWQCLDLPKENRRKEVTKRLWRLKSAPTRVRPPEFWDRFPRHLMYLMKFKAHELEMLVVYIAPFILSKHFPPNLILPWTCLCRIAWILNKPCISNEDLIKVRELADKFTKFYLEIFGEKNLNITGHMVMHLADIAMDYGQLHQVSCSNGEDQIRIAKIRLRSLNCNAGKHLANEELRALACRTALFERFARDDGYFSPTLESVVHRAIGNAAAMSARPTVLGTVSAPTGNRQTVIHNELSQKEQLLEFFPDRVKGSNIWSTLRLNIPGKFHVRTALMAQARQNETWFFANAGQTVVKIWDIVSVGVEPARCSRWFVIAQAWKASECSHLLDIEHYFSLPEGTLGHSVIMPVEDLFLPAFVLSDTRQINRKIPIKETVLAMPNRGYRTY